MKRTALLRADARTVRVPPGKTFGFIGDAFVPPDKLRQLGWRLKEGRPSYAIIDHGPRGPFVAAWTDQSELIQFDESDWIEVERVARETGEIFGADRPHPNVPGYLYRAWLSMPRDRRRAAEEVALRRQAQLRWQRETAGMTPAEIEAHIRQRARRRWEADVGGQASEAEYLLDMLQEAADAGLPVADLLATVREQVEAERARAAEIARREQEARRAREAQIAPYLQQAQAIVQRLLGRYRREDLPSLRQVQEALADGKGEEWAVAEAERRQANRLAQSDYPDTFGYCHGTDFEGGEW